jgi:hypothetical protein
MIVADIDVWRVASVISSRATDNEQGLRGDGPLKILNHLLALGVAILVSSGAGTGAADSQDRLHPFNVPIVFAEGATAEITGSSIPRPIWRGAPSLIL